MNMPKIGGKETFFCIRKIDPDAKVILISGYSVESEIQILLENGAKTFISKPFDITKFSNVIANVLGTCQ